MPRLLRNALTPREPAPTPQLVLLPTRERVPSQVKLQKLARRSARPLPKSVCTSLKDLCEL